jgi:hypothetical protein
MVWLNNAIKQAQGGQAYRGHQTAHLGLSQAGLESRTDRWQAGKRGDYQAPS